MEPKGESDSRRFFEDDGSILQTETIENGGDVRLLRAAVDGLQGTSFQPGRIDGQAKEMWTEVEIRFETDFADMAEIGFATTEAPEIISFPPQYDAVELATKLEYPQIARETGTEGSMIIKAIIQSNGNVSSAKIVESSNLLFNSTVKEAVGSTQFTPAIREEEPIRGSITLKVYFELKNEEDASIRIEEVAEKETFNPEDYPDFHPDRTPPNYDRVELASYLVYPKKAEDNGIEGTVYVVYVMVSIDDNG